MPEPDSFKQIISAHLNELAAKDLLFAETLKKPNKNINDCATYIMNQARKRGSAVAMADSEVFGMAVHYYDEDNIDIGKSSGGTVSTSKNAAAAKKETAGPAAAEKPKAGKKAEKKQIPVHASLFDI